MARKVFWAVVAVGMMLIVAPFALGIPSKASAGQRMMDGFRPLMQQTNVDKTATYYNDVFVPLGQVVPAMSQANIDKFSTYVQGFTAMGVDAQNLIPALATAMNMTPEQVQGFMAAQFPAMSQILQNLPAMQKDFDGLVTLMGNNVGIFEQVPAGLAHYEPLVKTMQANVANYHEADQLPAMGLFTWFFVVPGILLVGLGALGLFAGRKPKAADDHTMTPSTPVESAHADKQLVSSS